MLEGHTPRPACNFRRAGLTRLGPCIVVVMVLAACAHTVPPPDSKPDSQLPLNDLIDRLNGLNSTIERIRAEEVRSTDELRRQVSEETARQETASSERSILLTELQSKLASERGSAEQVLHELDIRL